MENQNNNTNGVLSGRTVMWVEDDKFLSELMAQKLSKEGAEVLFANSGDQVFGQVKEHKPDVILLDILLPDVDGFEVLEQIKTDPETKDIPVILFSNLSKEEDVQRGYDLGAEKFLVKSTTDPKTVVEELTGIFGA